LYLDEVNAIYHLTLNSGAIDIVPRRRVDSATIEAFERGMDNSQFPILPPAEICIPTVSGSTVFRSDSLPPLHVVHSENAGWSSASVLCGGSPILRLVTAWNDRDMALKSLLGTKSSAEEIFGHPIKAFTLPPRPRLPLSAMLILPCPKEWSPLFSFLGRAVDALSFAAIHRHHNAVLRCVYGPHWRN